jgi:hypothetical protein
VCGGEVVVDGEELYGGFGDVDIAAWLEGTVLKMKINKNSLTK